MKKQIFGLLAILALSACEPVVDNKELGGIVPESELKLEVFSTTEGGNEIVFVNHTKGVGTYWDYGLGQSIQEQDTVIFPFLGELEIKFNGFCNGGQINASRKITVSKLDHPVAPEWAIFAGNEISGKTWGWDYTSLTDIIFGAGGYLASSGPAWWVFSAEAMQTGDFKQDITEVMTFDLNGGPNFTKKKANGTVIEKGTFKFDMSKTKKKGDGSLYSIGELQFLDATIPFGVNPSQTNEKVYTFDIISLSATKMILAYAPAGTGVWENAYFWCFKSLQ